MPRLQKIADTIARSPYVHFVAGVMMVGFGVAWLQTTLLSVDTRSQQGAAAAAPAGTIPLSGWAWSGGDAADGPFMGWISFSSDNTPGESTYGVYQSVSDGSLSGYAWSSNLGWISFNASDVSGCPSGTCAPTVDLSTGQVTGWARACSAFTGSACSGTLDTRSGGWDGFIALSGSGGGTTFGITQNLATCQWSGYAWGSTNIGWINVNPVSGYGVRCAMPDLRAQYVDQITAKVGVAQNYTTTVTNIGAFKSTAPFYNVLQRTNSIDAGGNATGPITDLSVVSHSGEIATNGTAVITASYTFPNADADTARYVRICVDKNSAASTGDIAESDESNNCTAWKPIQVSGEPNLRAWSITQSSSTVGVSQTFAAPLSNNGTGQVSTPYFNLLQRVNSVDAGGNAVGTPVDITVVSQSGTLAATATTTLSANYTFVAGDSGMTRYLRWCADSNTNASVGQQNDVDELSEVDNCGPWKAIAVSAAPAADYTANAVSPSTSIVARGQAITYNGSINNPGAAAGTNVPSVFRFKSQTGTVLGYLGAGTTTSVAAGATNVAVTAATYATSTAGTYKVDLCANMGSAGAIPFTQEPNFGNNCGPEFTIVYTSVDIAPNGALTVATPASGTTSAPVSFSSAMYNMGTGEATNFHSVFQVVNYPGRTTTHARISAGTTTSLSALNATTLTASFSTSTPGTYSVRACGNMSTGGVVGTALNETDTNNNCGEWREVTIMPASLPDLVAHSISTGFATNGVPTNISFLVGNTGATTTASVTNRIRLSRDSSGAGAASLTSVMAGVPRYPSTTAGSVGPYTFTYNPSLTTYSLAGATYFLELCVDTANVVAESREDNNCTVWDGVESAYPWDNPLIKKEMLFVQGPEVTAGSVVPTTAVASTTVTLAAPIWNMGSVDTPANFVNKFQRATDSNGTGATDIGTYTQSAAIPEWLDALDWVPDTYPYPVATSTRSYTFAAATTTYVRACADSNSLFAELIEGNNCGPWTRIVVSAAVAPDATANTPIANPTSYAVGTSTRLTGSVNNIGNASIANVPSVYRIKNQAGTVTYQRLSAGTKSTLGAGVTNSATVANTFATTTPGTYTIDICINMNTLGQFPVIAGESNTGNNCGGSITVTVTPPPPTGTITPNSCTIAAGASSCAMNVVWTSANTTGTVTVRRAYDSNSVFATGVSGTQEGTFTPPGTYHMDLYDGATKVGSGADFVASCASGTSWDGTKCASTGGSCSNGATNYPDCDNNGGSCSNGATNYPACDNGGGGGGTVNGACAPTHYNCSAGTAANFPGQDTSGAYIWDCMGSGTGHTDALGCAEAKTQPPDTTPTVDLTANPSIVGKGGVTYLSWSGANITGCSIAGTNGYAATGLATSGTNQPTSAMNDTTTYTITCTGTSGSTATDSVEVVIFDPDDF